MIDLSSVPTSPGCYLYKNEEGTIIYVGKAKNLKRRVSSYFQKRDHDPKTKALVRNIRSAEFIVTANEVEALILENTLIKKHSPKYNIDLKDSKSYAFIHISDDEFPRIGILRKATTKGKLYGPFVSAKERDYLLTLLKKTFRLRSCRNLPKRACLRAHMGTCSAPCIGKISAAEYRENVSRAESVLKGNADELVARLTDEMKKCAAERDFERAIEYREQITSLSHLSAHQNMKRQITYDQDVIGYLIRSNRVYIIVFNVIHGTLVGKEEFTFAYEQNFLEEFLVRYYSEHQVPGEIILPASSDVLEEEQYTAPETDDDGKPETIADGKQTETDVCGKQTETDAGRKQTETDAGGKQTETDAGGKQTETDQDDSRTDRVRGNLSIVSERSGERVSVVCENEPDLSSVRDEDLISRSLIEFLSQRRGRTVRLTVPKRGDKKDLLILAEKNIEAAFFGQMAKVEELGRKLMLDKPPSVIECFDISHLSGTHTVASMVQFRDGKADKSNYRRFRIKTVDGINDFESIAEVVERRYSRLLEEEKDLPDLILIDGGKGQLSYACDVLRELGVRTPVISLAEREEEIFVPGLSDPLPIRKSDKASMYLQEIRDEAHRFAITYNRLLRDKALKEDAQTVPEIRKAEKEAEKERRARNRKKE